MARNILRALIALILLMASSNRVEQVSAFDVLGYYADDYSDQEMQDSKAYLTQVSFDQYTVNRKGVIQGSVSPAGALAYAKQHFVNFMVVSNWGPTDFNSATIHAILRSSSTQKRLISKLSSQALALGYNGVNIDFEAVPPHDRSLLTAFINSLSNSLHAVNLKLVMSVPAVTVDDPTDSWAGAYDFTQLGKAVDILQVMTYDENGPWGPPGPVAGLDWVKSCIEFTKTVVTNSKISMGVPAYGYDWNTDANTGVSLNYQQVEDLISQLGVTTHWDSASSSPYFKYVDSSDNSHHTVWYENAQSLKLKGQYARSANIAGISIWSLDGLNTEFWTNLT